MHFALPPRKTSRPPPYLKPSSASRVRSLVFNNQRRGLKLLGGVVCSFLAVYFLLYHRSLSPTTVSSPPPEAPPGTPPIVIVTVFDQQKMSGDYISKIQVNREDYAKRHGYTNFFTTKSNYTQYSKPAPDSWTLVPALRHALTLYPYATYFWSLSPHALIMDPSLSLEKHILETARLESLMRKNVPVVPPDSVIRTFSRLKADKVDLILTQDAENIGTGSFIIRGGEWAKFMLDSWFNPLYRAYNFQKAEQHAMEHIVQWHPTILARMALLPQRIMNSYNFDIRLDDPKGANKEPHPSGVYQEGDFVVNLHGCGTTLQRNCDEEMRSYYVKWQAAKTSDKAEAPS